MGNSVISNQHSVIRKNLTRASLRALQKAGRGNPVNNFSFLGKEPVVCPWITTPPAGARDDGVSVSFLNTDYWTLITDQRRSADR